MEQQISIAQLIENAVRVLQLLQAEPEVSETFSVMDGTMFRTTVLNAGGHQIFSKTEPINNTQELVELVDKQEQSLQQKLALVQAEKTKIQTEIDKLP